MTSRMDEFRKFVNNHQTIRNDVLSGKRTWQQIYEDWVILGEGDESWKQYETTKEEPPKSSSKKLEDLFTSENMKTIVGYIKKINPDTLSKTLNTIQKVLQITQGFGSNASSGLYNANYNSWWD